MYVVLKKGEKKAQVVKQATWELKPHLYRKYELIKATDSWKEAQTLLRKIKRGEPLVLVPPQAVPIDVRWTTKPGGIAFVYGLYDENNKLLYIGVTSNPSFRCDSHIKQGKTFSYMNVLFSFKSREEAESYERFAIASLNPPINILVEGLRPGFSHTLESLEAFGELSDIQPLPKITTYKQATKNKPKKPIVKKKKNKRDRTTLFCTNCGMAAGKNNRYILEDGTARHLKPCMSPEERAESKRILKERNDEIKRRNRPNRQNKDAGPKCKYCKKPLSQGRHIPCRKRRLKELGRI